jgi:hypothetical protein
MSSIETKTIKFFVPSAICWTLVSLLPASQAAEKASAYRAPRQPDGHVDMQGMWKNSNLTPLERPPGFTQLAITAADAKQIKEQYLNPSGSQNQPDDPDRALEERSIEPIRGELRSSQIIAPQDGKIPWNEAYRDKPVALLHAILSAFDNPEQRPGPERCLSSTGAPPMQPTLDGNMYEIVKTPATTVIVSESIHDSRMIRMNGAHSPAALTSWLGTPSVGGKKTLWSWKQSFFRPAAQFA